MESRRVTKLKTPENHSNRVQRNAPAPDARLRSLGKSIGNRALQRLVNTPFIQTKLQVSQPDDPLEQEADVTADKVMRMADLSQPAQVTAAPQTASSQPATDRENEIDDKDATIARKTKSHRIPLAVRENDEETEATADLAEDKKQLSVQKKGDELEEEGKVQRKRGGTGNREHQGTFSQDANNTLKNIHSLSGSGRPLSESNRAFFEPRFGADFSGVRLHTSSMAAQSAKSLNARAFTVGNNIAFGDGQFDPESHEGRKLLAHELTHTIQQGAANVSSTHGRPQNSSSSQQTQPTANSSSTTVARDPLQITQAHSHVDVISRSPEDEQRLHDLPFSAFKTKPHFKLAFLNVYAEATDAIPKFEERIVEACMETVEGLNVDRSIIASAAHDIAAVVGTLNVNGTDMEFHLDGAVKSLHELMPSNSIETVHTSFGFEYIYNRLVEHSAEFVAVSLQENEHAADIAADQGLMSVAASSDTSLLQLEQDLVRVIEALSDGQSALMLELEGLVGHLAELRQQFIDSDTDAERKTNMEERSEIARRAVLINDKIMDMMDNPSAPTPLDQTVKDVISTAGRTAKSEEETRKELGDSKSLLAAQPLNLPERVDDPYFAESGLADEAWAREIRPNLAFPKTTDDFMSKAHVELADRIERQSKGLEDQIKKIVPPPTESTYTLAEFAKVYKHWFGLFGGESEKQKLAEYGVLDVWTGLHSATSIGALSVGDNVALAAFRYFTMKQTMQSLQGLVSSGVDTDFDRLTRKQGLHRTQELKGTKASDTSYEFGEVYGQASPSSSGEEASRENLASYQAGVTSQKFSQVAKAPGAIQPYLAFQTNLTKNLLPVLGFRTVEAKEGWSYLIDVTSVTGDTVAYEHKVASPEVANYLLAYQQHENTLNKEHSATVPVRSPQKQGTSTVSKAVGSGSGLFAPLETGMSSERGRLDRADASARSAIGIGGRDTQRRGPNGTIFLNGIMVEYLNHFFKQAESALRIAAIFHLMNVEHGIGKVFDKMFDPEEIAKVMAKAFGISFGLGVLSGLGPIGQALSLGIGKILKVAGGSEITSALTVAGFLKEAAGADSFSQARLMGYIGLPIIADIQMLFESMISMPAAMAGHKGGEATLKYVIDRINQKPPATVGEAADLARKIGEVSPEAQKEMLDAVESYIADLQKQGAGQTKSDKDYEMLVAFRDALKQQSRVNQILDPYKTKLEFTQPDPKSTPFIDPNFRLRTAGEKAKLLEAMGDLAGKVPLIQDPTLSGATVRVYYSDGKVRLHVGKDATAHDVSLHMPTVRTLRKYEGFGGTLRLLLARLAKMLDLTKSPDYGKKGWEAQLEIKKLTEIQNDLMRQMDAIDLNARKLIDGQVTREALELHFIEIQAQLTEHLRNVDSMDAGVGFIAARKQSSPSAAKAKALKLGEDPPLGHAWREKDGRLDLVHLDKDKEGLFINQEILKTELDKGQLGDPKLAIRPISEQGSAGTVRARELGLEKHKPPGHVWRLDPTGTLSLARTDNKAPHKWFDYESYSKAQDKSNPASFIKDIATKADSNSDSARFAAQSWTEAYVELGGDGTTSSFGKFRKVLEGFGVTRNDVIERMKVTPQNDDRGPSPEGLGVRTIRHTTKEHFVEKVIMPYLNDEAGLTETPLYQKMIEAGNEHKVALTAASHERLLEISRQLDSADRGSLGEKWYEARFGEPTASQFSIGQKAVEGVDLGKDRNIDRLEVTGDKANLREIKNVTGSLNEARLQGEMDAHLALRGKDIKDGKKVYTVEKVTWVLLDPKTLGETGSKKFIETYLSKGAVFEVQTPDGVKILTSSNYVEIARQYGGAK